MTFQEAQDYCRPALSNDKDRPSLTGFGVWRNCETARVVATDTHRLHIATIPIEHAPGAMPGHPDATVALAGGPFPNWQRVMPKEHTRSATIRTPELIEALAVFAKFAKGDSHRTVLEFNGESLTMSAKGDVGIQLVATIATADTFNADGFRIAVNAGYLLDAVRPFKKAGSKLAILRFTEWSRPFTVELDSTGTDYTALIMPMALG